MATVPRVSLICDYSEEGWPSMDLVGDMLFQHLSQRVLVRQVRPAMRFRFQRLPGLPASTARNVDRLLGRFLDYPSHLKSISDQPGVFHLVDHSYSHLVHSLPAERTVVTCHDLDTFRCLLDPLRERRPVWFRWMAQRILDGLRKAAKVICVSSATRDELLAHRLVAADHIRVIPNGVHPSCSPEPDPAADSIADRLLASTGHNAQLLLHVGSTIPRKNIEGLLTIFAAVRRAVPNAWLLRVGGKFTPGQEALLRQLDLTKWILVLPFLDRPVLAAVYRRARALLLPSLGEGFGLPVIEAMACGCPVLGSDLPVLREVGGDAMQYCSPFEPDAWVHALRETLTIHSATQHTLLARAAMFSWPETVRQLIDSYQELPA